jgi:hypothetical protein
MVRTGTGFEDLTAVRMLKHHTLVETTDCLAIVTTLARMGTGYENLTVVRMLKCHTLVKTIDCRTIVTTLKLLVVVNIQAVDALYLQEVAVKRLLQLSEKRCCWTVRRVITEMCRTPTPWVVLLAMYR